MRRYLLFAFLLLAVWAIVPSLVRAQDPTVQVTSNAPVSILIDGQENSRFPTTAKRGVYACLANPISYISEGERYMFDKWSTGVQDNCVLLDKPGTYTALFNHEVLLETRSVLKEYQKSQWVVRRSPVQLEVPPVVTGDPGVRYIFEEWSSGESRFAPQNRIALTRPTTVDVKWRTEYYIQVVGPEGANVVGTGWHQAKTYVVLKAPPELPGASPQERLRFAKWEGISNPAILIANANSPLISYTVDGPHAIHATYQRDYLVVAQTPWETLKREWAFEGKEIVVETPALKETIPDQERYVFKGWQGTDQKGSRVSLVADQPLELKALYQRQFMVKASAPYGASGGGWYDEGAQATITVPENPKGVLFLKNTFDQFPGYASRGPTLRVPVTGPMTITASYRTQVDLKTLAILLGALVIISAVYLLTQRMRPQPTNNGKEKHAG